jgi:hypothetical protein
VVGAKLAGGGHQGALAGSTRKIVLGAPPPGLDTTTLYRPSVTGPDGTGRQLNVPPVPVAVTVTVLTESGLGGVPSAAGGG